VLSSEQFDDETRGRRLRQLDEIEIFEDGG
jgi:hypothetical protein